MSVTDKSPHPISVPDLDLSAGDLLAPESDPISYSLLIHVGSVLKTLGHPDRLRIIQYLSQGEQCVTDIQNHIGMSQPITSQQLRIMADKHIVARRREGNVVFYRVANDFIWKILDCMNTLSAKIGSGEWSLEQVGALEEGDPDE